MYQTLIFWQYVANSKDAKRVGEPWKILLHCAWLSTIPHWNFSELKINDILFPLSLDLREIRIFWHYFHCCWLQDQENGSTLMSVEGSFLPPTSIHAQIIVKGICRNGTAIKCKKETMKTWMWLMRSCGIMLCEAQCFAMTVLVNCQINLPTADKIKQTGTTCSEKSIQQNHTCQNIMFD